MSGFRLSAFGFRQKLSLFLLLAGIVPPEAGCIPDEFGVPTRDANTDEAGQGLIDGSPRLATLDGSAYDGPEPNPVLPDTGPVPACDKGFCMTGADGGLCNCPKMCERAPYPPDGGGGYASPHIDCLRTFAPAFEIQELIVCNSFEDHMPGCFYINAADGGPDADISGGGTYYCCQ